MKETMTYWDGLPLIYLTPADLNGVEVISLVDHPANETEFLALAEQQRQRCAFKMDEDRHLVTGVALIPDQKIYRADYETGTEWYVTFTRDAIERTAQKFLRDHKGEGVTLMHAGKVYHDLYWVESYLTDKARGISPAEFGDLPDGTWMVTCKVDDHEVWAMIKDGTLRGFSIEGIFAQEARRSKALDSLDDFFNAINS